MLDAPPGRFLTILRAERVDPREAWQYRHHSKRH